MIDFKRNIRFWENVYTFWVKCIYVFDETDIRFWWNVPTLLVKRTSVFGEMYLRFCKKVGTFYLNWIDFLSESKHYFCKHLYIKYLQRISKFAYLRENIGLLDKNARRSVKSDNISLQKMIWVNWSVSLSNRILQIIKLTLDFLSKAKYSALLRYQPMNKGISYWAYYLHISPLLALKMLVLPVKRRWKEAEQIGTFVR